MFYYYIMQLTKEEAKYIYSKPKGHYIRLYQLGKNKGISNVLLKNITMRILSNIYQRYLKVHLNQKVCQKPQHRRVEVA